MKSLPWSISIRLPYCGCFSAETTAPPAAATTGVPISAAKSMPSCIAEAPVIGSMRQPRKPTDVVADNRRHGRRQRTANTFIEQARFKRSQRISGTRDGATLVEHAVEVRRRLRLRQQQRPAPARHGKSGLRSCGDAGQRGRPVHQAHPVPAVAPASARAWRPSRRRLSRT